MREQILSYAVKYKGDCTKIAKAILNNEAYERIEYNGHYVTILDPEYPTCLLQLNYRPWILFYEGNIKLLNDKCVGVVGSRIYSEQAKNNTILLIRHLAKAYTIVSGLAKGVDALAHQQAITMNRHTIGVLGCGLDVVYPKENENLYIEMRKYHLIVSEYPNGTKPLAHHFPWRNRIVSALSSSLIVVEAKVRSGTLISVNEALELGKDVYCFPYSFLDENGLGCNLLIQSGCQVLCTIQDLEEI